MIAGKKVWIFNSKISQKPVLDTVEVKLQNSIKLEGTDLIPISLDSGSVIVSRDYSSIFSLHLIVISEDLDQLWQTVRNEEKILECSYKNYLKYNKWA